MSRHNYDCSRKSIKSNMSDEEQKSDNFKKIMINNREWAKKCVEQDPDYFLRYLHIQKPKYLWIGCSDSRVSANQIMGLKPGQVFVHRNIANIASPADINVLAVIQYAVEHLRVEDIIVSGHYKCGGIKAAFKQNDFGPLQSWLSQIRELRCKFRDSLLGNQEQKEHTLIELNVKQQVINVSRNPAVQQAWSHGQKLHIHGVVYNIADGILKDLGLTTSNIQHVPEQYRIAKRPREKKEKKENKQDKQLKLKSKRRISQFQQVKQKKEDRCKQHIQKDTQLTSQSCSCCINESNRKKVRQKQNIIINQLKETKEVKQEKPPRQLFKDLLVENQSQNY